MASSRKGRETYVLNDVKHGRVRLLEMRGEELSGEASVSEGLHATTVRPPIGLATNLLLAVHSHGRLGPRAGDGLERRPCNAAEGTRGASQTRQRHGGRGVKLDSVRESQQLNVGRSEWDRVASLAANAARTG